VAKLSQVYQYLDTMKKNSITVAALRQIIREEIRRTIIIEARNAIVSAVGPKLIREWGEKTNTDIQKTQATGYGKHADLNQSTRKNDVVAEMQKTLNLLDDAAGNENITIKIVTSQLKKLHQMLTSADDPKYNTWAVGVKKALENVESIASDPRQRRNRIQLASNAVQSLGKDKFYA
jgi:hypothetical protein